MPDGVSAVHAIEGDINASADGGIINMDAAISPDGETLFFARTKFGLLGGGPSESNLIIAHKKNDTFIIDPQSSTILKSVNTGDLEYAPAITDDGLELYFTRYQKGGLPKIMVATRNSVSQPFNNPDVVIDDGFVEAPSLSSDKSLLYFHKKINGKSILFVAERKR